MRRPIGWRSNQSCATEASLLAGILMTALGATMTGCASDQPSVTSGKWVNLGIVLEGADKELCDSVFAHVMSLRPACRVDGVETYPGFTAPQWQTVDAAAHRSLLQSLLRYARLISTPEFEAEISNTGQYWQKRADDFLSRGGKMEVWTTDLLTPTGQPRRTRTIVRLIDNPGAERNDGPGPYSKNRGPQTFIVDDAMQAPANDVDRGLGSRLAESSVVLFEGEAMLINMNFVGRVSGNVCYFSRTIR